MTRSALRIFLITTALSLPGAALAQDAATFVEAFNAPVFESVDQNGVDLVSGSLRIATPVLETGSEYRKDVYGLQWTGKGWTIVGRPTLWRDGDKYIVNYRGASEEFNDHSNNFSQRKPINGASLACDIYMPGNIATECVYIDRYGDVVHFKGRITQFASYGPNYGHATFAWGNVGMSEAYIYSIDQTDRQYGHAGPYGYGEGDYYDRVVTRTLGQQTFKITTPNHDNDGDEHYLRPNNTVQTVTDSVGSVWQYTINDNRRMTRIVLPDGTATNITYNDGKVSSVVTPGGTWTYSYGSFGLSSDFGHTTVRNPMGEETYVKYHRDRGYVTESRDSLQRWTYYVYDSGHRPIRITYPEGNSVQFTYDARGNILTKTIVPKPSVGGPALVERADYEPTCTDFVLCNRPRWTEDAKGARTDFAYAPTTARPIARYTGTGNWPVTTRQGTGKPAVVTSPAVGGIRPQVRTSYVEGLPQVVSTCLTQASCAGTSDEVVTSYLWGHTMPSLWTLMGKTVTAGGVTLRTCYGYDINGRVVSETPPAAGLTSCPSNGTTPPPVAATMPTHGTPAVAPTFPDGTSSGGGGAGGSGGDGEFEQCGGTTGRICP